jgi:hypothetical protein
MPKDDIIRGKTKVINEQARINDQRREINVGSYSKLQP